MIKKERFKKVAETRTVKILKMVELLGNCSNKNNYEYSDAEIKKIFDAIEKQVKETKKRFEKTARKKEKFSL